MSLVNTSRRYSRSDAKSYARANLRDPWPTRRLMPIAYLKAWCDLLGMVGGPVRSPLLQVTPAEQAALREDLASVGLL
jgi:4-hydroxy-tetrahydrodipicolinate synthase